MASWKGSLTGRTRPFSFDRDKPSASSSPVVQAFNLHCSIESPSGREQLTWTAGRDRGCPMIELGSFELDLETSRFMTSNV